MMGHGVDIVSLNIGDAITGFGQISCVTSKIGHVTGNIDNRLRPGLRHLLADLTTGSSPRGIQKDDVRLGQLGVDMSSQRADGLGHIAFQSGDKLAQPRLADVLAGVLDSDRSTFNAQDLGLGEESGHRQGEKPRAGVKVPKS